MGKNVLHAEVGENKYVFEFTRSSICEAEATFGVSMMKMGDFATYGEFNTFVNALLYAGLKPNQPDVVGDSATMEKIHSDLAEAGYDETQIIESLVKLLGDAINPTTGGRKKTFLTVKK